MTQIWLESLAKLVNYKSSEFNPYDIIEEANNKLINCYILLNNKELVKYKTANLESISFTDLDGNSKNILLDNNTTFSRFWPKPGIYLTDNSYFSIYRTSTRQWKRSYCPGENYTPNSLLGVKAVFDDKKETKDYIKIDRYTAFHKHNNSLFYKHIPIAFCELLDGWIKIKKFPDFLYDEIKNKWPNFLIQL